LVYQVKNFTWSVYIYLFYKAHADLFPLLDFYVIHPFSNDPHHSSELVSWQIGKNLWRLRADQSCPSPQLKATGNQQNNQGWSFDSSQLAGTN
jgi:hypothetical protein